jgi:hypothetical protein
MSDNLPPCWCGSSRRVEVASAIGRHRDTSYECARCERRSRLFAGGGFVLYIAHGDHCAALPDSHIKWLNDAIGPVLRHEPVTTDADEVPATLLAWAKRIGGEWVALSWTRAPWGGECPTVPPAAKWSQFATAAPVAMAAYAAEVDADGRPCEEQ